jgi:predicted unusual protein kinase regulating ubiquinone biosynthesis (AarF/ABC1/UbiB family)
VPNVLECLEQYDPQAIARYYRRSPWQLVARTWVILWSFTGFLLGLFTDRLRGQTHTIQRAEQLRHILTDLGPTFIKVGQALSTRPDLVRQDFLDELIKLQDRLPAFPNDQAFDIIQKELGESVNAVFATISPEPVAAASLGQVYKAQLMSGDAVAVKVQRPNLLPTLTLDLCLIRWGADQFGRFLPLNLGHNLTIIVDEFGTKLFEEVDYENEGCNAERFAANFEGCPYVKVPEIYWAFTSKHVLTLEWIEGCKLTTGQLICAGLDPNAIVKTGVIAGLQQLLEFGFFHADPHPGNLFALPIESNVPEGMGRMAYVDFGMMDQLDESTKETLVDAVVHLINRDYEELATDFVKLGFLAPNTDIRPIIPALESVLGDVMGEKVRDFNFKTITDRFSELMYDYPFRVPAKFALIIRSLVTQEGLALSVNPDFKIVEVAYPYIAKRLLSGESPAIRRRLLEVLFKDGKFRWNRLENLLRIARSDGQLDLGPTAQLGLQLLISQEGSSLRRKLLLALIEDDRLHAEEVQRLWELVKDDIRPAQLVGSALNSIAAFSLQQATKTFPALSSLGLNWGESRQ